MRTLAFVAISLASCGKQTCGTTSPCKVATGEYYLSVPDKLEPNAPVFVHFHGFGGDGKSQLGGSLDGFFVDQGYVVVFPVGQDGGWDHQGLPNPDRDESVFMDQVKADVTARFETDPGRWLVSGFSSGGSMAWHLACFRPDAYRAFAPASGAFWTPLPTTCDGPVRLRHTHGLNDTTLPIDGQQFTPEVGQGSSYLSRDVLIKVNQCDPTPRVDEQGVETCETYDCETGALVFCSYEGGHRRSEGWNQRTLDWFESL